MKHSLRKRVGAYAVMLCLLITLLPVTVFAQPHNNVDNTTDNSIKIPSDAIKISTPEDLLALAEKCRENTWSVGKVVVLEKNIDMSKVKFGGIPTFGGTFLGQDHTISGIHMEQKSSVLGFFRYLQKGAKVDSLNIKGNYILDGTNNTIGGFVGKNAGHIMNCTFEGIVAGAQQVGGFAGINEASGIIEGCNISGTVFGNHFVGGIAGENHGVVRYCQNAAEINAQSDQNEVPFKEITLDSLKYTERASKATDIGGITGSNTGVVRNCVNKARVGYQHMGYNLGGIAGIQNGFIVDCENYGNIQGRQDVGGILGQNEPNIVLEYDRDTIDILSKQMGNLGVAIGQANSNFQVNSETVNQQLQSVGEDLVTAVKSANTLKDAWKIKNIILHWDEFVAANSNLSSSLISLYDNSIRLKNSIKTSTDNVKQELNSVVGELDKILNTIEHLDNNINFSSSDISGHDKEDDTLAKVSNCVNYANVMGNINVGGIAGALAEERDYDELEDTNIDGDFSFNVDYHFRAVVRDCSNRGMVKATKKCSGGIVGLMKLGAVLDCINVGNLDSINADYVGGIAGNSDAIIRDCSAKSIMAGKAFVGGIAGKGKEVKDCNAFVDVKVYEEKAGAIVGFTDELPNGKNGLIIRNHYFNAGKEIGGIDGITYTNATDKLELTEFLDLPNLSDLFRIVTVRFIEDGKEDVIYNLKVGESLKQEQVPSIDGHIYLRYHWVVIPAITYEELSMGDVATIEYLKEENLTNIMFNQTYEVTFDLKDVVIGSTQRNNKNLCLVLAEGIFSKDTIITLVDSLSSGRKNLVNGKEVAECWHIAFSNPGVRKVHYLISDKLDADNLKLYVKNSSGNWVQRDYVLEGSYIIFDFMDGEAGFALQEDSSKILIFVVLLILLVAADVLVILYVKKRNKQVK